MWCLGICRQDSNYLQTGLNIYENCKYAVLHRGNTTLMSTDQFFYCAPCRLKVLVTPLGQVSASYFSRVLQILREYKSIPLNALDADKLSDAFLSPQTFPQGILLLQYMTDWQSDKRHLEDFQPSRRLYAVRSPYDIRADGLGHRYCRQQ
jgi:Transport protein Trs120 or TRAPPC9, TRAPP II complex subunit